MLYILLFKQNSLGRLTPLIPLIILAFYVRINSLSRKRTPSSNSSYKVRVLLSNKGEKRKVTKAKNIVILTKQIKQEIRIIIAVMSIRWIILLSLQV